MLLYCAVTPAYAVSAADLYATKNQKSKREGRTGDMRTKYKIETNASLFDGDSRNFDQHFLFLDLKNVEPSMFVYVLI